MSSSNIIEKVTSPGDSDSLQGTAAGGRCSPQGSLPPSGAKGVGMLKQVPTASNGAGNITVVEGEKQALDGGRKATEVTVQAKPGISRAQAEARYCKTLEEINKHLTSLEKNLQAATNTRGDIKSGIKDLGASIREFTKVANVLGMTRNPDAVEKCLKQQQLQQQKTMDILKEIQAAQRLERPLEPPSYENRSSLAADVVKGFQDLNSRMDMYEKRVDKILEIKQETTKLSTGEWTEVVKRSKKQKQQTVPDAASTKEKVDGRKRNGKRNPAIVVDSRPEDFPALAKKLSKEVDQQVIGNRVMAMRQTRKGAMLIEINGDATVLDTIKAEITKAAGDGASVRALPQRGLLEILGIACWSEKDDVVQALVRSQEVKPEEINVINIRKTYGGTIAAIVLVPLHITEKIVAAGRLKVGMVYCGVRMAEKRVKCYRCLATGHESRECTGPNREKCCRKCGRDGHFAAQCDSDEEATMTFRRLLQKESTRKPEQTTGRNNLAREIKAPIADGSATRVAAENEEGSNLQ